MTNDIRNGLGSFFVNLNPKQDILIAWIVPLGSSRICRMASAETRSLFEVIIIFYVIIIYVINTIYVILETGPMVHHIASFDRWQLSKTFGTWWTGDLTTIGNPSKTMVAPSHSIQWWWLLWKPSKNCDRVGSTPLAEKNRQIVFDGLPLDIWAKYWRMWPLTIGLEFLKAIELDG